MDILGRGVGLGPPPARNEVMICGRNARPESFSATQGDGEDGGRGAAVYNRLLCDSYALVILGILPDRKLARGTKGRGAYEDLLEEFQLAKCGGPGGRMLLLPCPTCNAFAYRYELDQVAQGEFLRQGMAVLTPSVLVSFEDGQPPPLYRDENAGGDGKPRWKLCQGVGPAGLSWIGAARGGPQAEPGTVRRRRQALTLPEQLQGPRELSEAVHEACARRSHARRVGRSAAALTRWRIATGERAGVTGGHRPCWRTGGARAALGSRTTPRGIWTRWFGSG